MWIERFVIVVTSLAQNQIPSEWGFYVPTWVDWGILLGTLATFGLLFLLFLRFVPSVPIHELKKLRMEIAEEGAP
jgi:molybdopterin-containing oxidoreductase family membrane subunit